MKIVKLTEKYVNSLTNEGRKILLDYYQDLACNIDYTVQPILNNIVQYNINVLESKIIFKEY